MLPTNNSLISSRLRNCIDAIEMRSGNIGDRPLWLQHQLVEMCGEAVPITLIRGWLSGTHRPPAAMCEKLPSILGADEAWFTFGKTHQGPCVCGSNRA